METIQPMVVTSEFQVTKVNNVSITCIENNNKRFIPIKPICEALGISMQKQLEKLKNDEDLASTVTMRVMVAQYGKEREIFLRFVFNFNIMLKKHITNLQSNE